MYFWNVYQCLLFVCVCVFILQIIEYLCLSKHVRLNVSQVCIRNPWHPFESTDNTDQVWRRKTKNQHNPMWFVLRRSQGLSPLEARITYLQIKGKRKEKNCCHVTWIYWIEYYCHRTNTHLPNGWTRLEDKCSKLLMCSLHLFPFSHLQNVCLHIYYRENVKLRNTMERKREEVSLITLFLSVYSFPFFAFLSLREKESLNNQTEEV